MAQSTELTAGVRCFSAKKKKKRILETIKQNIL
jgi:hypothetical protein